MFLLFSLIFQVNFRRCKYILQCIYRYTLYSAILSMDSKSKILLCSEERVFCIFVYIPLPGHHLRDVSTSLIGHILYEQLKEQQGSIAHDKINIECVGAECLISQD